MSTRDQDRFIALAFCRADLLFELDTERKIQFAAGATPALFQKMPEDLVGASFLDLIAEDDRDAAADALSSAETNRIDDLEIALAGGGSFRPMVSVSGYRVPDLDNNYFLAMKVKTAAQADTAETVEEAEDAGDLVDAESFGEAAGAQIEQAIKDGHNPRLTMVKIRNLSSIIGQLGTSEGDVLLRQIGNLLRQESIGADLAGRIDDESFSYVHGDGVDVEDVNRQIEVMAKEAAPEGAEVYSTSATLDAAEAEMTQDQLARAIIHTMQQFCESDGNTRDQSLSEAFAGMMTDTVENIEYFKRISAKRDFDLVFMPICDLTSGDVHHFEALTRFRDGPGGGSPYHLINLAEKMDIICNFDIAVCKKAIEAVNKYHKDQPIPSVAVNISGRSISTPAFVNKLLRLISKDAKLPDRIMFEITESARIEDLETINNVLQAIRGKNFKICLDDFGAGAASFDYLNGLDVDIVKFDGPVMRRACGTKKGNDLLRDMARMCENLKTDTVAEMIEDKEMSNQAFYCGINFGQGWYFGKPEADPLTFADKFAAHG